MLDIQWFATRTSGAGSDQSHAPPSRASNPDRISALTALRTRCSLALAIWLAAPLGAQIRGSTWVRATVLPAQQSHEALDVGLVALAGGRALARSPLATIRIIAPGLAPPASGAVSPSFFTSTRMGTAAERVTAVWPVTSVEPARRRRSALVQIDFLRN